MDEPRGRGSDASGGGDAMDLDNQALAEQLGLDLEDAIHQDIVFFFQAATITAEEVDPALVVAWGDGEIFEGPAVSLSYPDETPLTLEQQERALEQAAALLREADLPVAIAHMADGVRIPFVEIAGDIEHHRQMLMTYAAMDDDTRAGMMYRLGSSLEMARLTWEALGWGAHPSADGADEDDDEDAYGEMGADDADDADDEEELGPGQWEMTQDGEVVTLRFVAEDEEQAADLHVHIYAWFDRQYPVIKEYVYPDGARILKRASATYVLSRPRLGRRRRAPDGAMSPWFPRNAHRVRRR